MTRKRTVEFSFEEMRRVFLAFGLERVRRTRFRVTTRGDNTKRGGRTVAGCRSDGLLVEASPVLADMPATTRLAILAHELGHATDFLYPGTWLDDGQGTPDLRAWRRRTPDEIERAADQIAEAASGIGIGYGGRRLLQSFACGVRPRPKDLGPFGPGTLR